MRLHVWFDTDNDAFQDGKAEFEIPAILSVIGGRVAEGDTGGRIDDSNGNFIGEWSHKRTAQEIEDKNRAKLAEHFEVADPEDLWFSPTGWNCPSSPTGTCVYNQEEDPDRDFCLACDQPRERL